MAYGATCNNRAHGNAADGLSVARRSFVAAVFAVCALLFALCAVRPVQADEYTGYLTVSGVSGVDETAAFSTLPDALAAIAACDPAAQDPAFAGAAVVVHGAVQVDAAGMSGRLFQHPVDGATFALVGADASARLAVWGGALELNNPTGSVAAHGLIVSGDLTLLARDGVAVDACSFDGTLVCVSGGNVAVSGNTFNAALVGDTAALIAVLLDSEGAMSVEGNTFAGYAAAVSAGCANVENRNAVSVSSNQFDLRCAAPELPEPTAVLVLEGGVWAPASVAFDANTVLAATELVRLADSFVASVPQTDPVVYEGVLEGNLSAQVVLSLFADLGVATSKLSGNLIAVALDPAFDGTPVAEQVYWASQELLPVDPSAAPLCTVSYDGNGAVAGVAPEPCVVQAGTLASAANMGSLVNPNCVFQGWNTAPDGSGTFYAVGQAFTVQANVVLYAQWASTGTVATMDVAAVGEAGR